MDERHTGSPSSNADKWLKLFQSLIDSSDLLPGDLFEVLETKRLGMFMRRYSYTGQNNEFKEWSVVLWTHGPVTHSQLPQTVRRIASIDKAVV